MEDRTSALLYRIRVLNKRNSVPCWTSEIAVTSHCFGCTASAGSSCGGALT